MKVTRTTRLLALLLAHKGERVALYDVQREAGAQHGARIKELRGRGYAIENETERVDGVTRSWYVLMAEPGENCPL
jgi:2-polyprenyl-6-methoxyphenol hydroxylase-like FAD-dependent oxidoreductase